MIEPGKELVTVAGLDLNEFVDCVGEGNYEFLALEDVATVADVEIVEGYPAIVFVYGYLDFDLFAGRHCLVHAFWHCFGLAAS